jgi:hypothetical protein
VRWLNTVAQAATADLGALIQVVGQLLNQTLALRELAVDLTQQIVGRLRVIADLKKGMRAPGSGPSIWSTASCSDHASVPSRCAMSRSPSSLISLGA